MHAGLRRYWPPEGQILLLIAALADLETARRAWQQWNARQELSDATSPEVRLLAAVARRMPDLAPGVPLDPRLVGARRYIWTHTQLTLGTTRPLLAAMRADGLRLMLIKGAARLASDPMLAQERALQDIDVLVHPEDWERALNLARREGWMHKYADKDMAGLRRIHALGLRSPRPGAKGEFDLHRHVLTECRNQGQDSGLWQRGEPVRFLGIDVVRPSTTDFALVTLAQSMLYSAAPVAAHWALDVDPLIRRNKIDWDLLLREVHARCVAPFVAAPLLMLQERVGCPLLPEVLRDLTRRIGKHGMVEFGMRATGYGPRLPEQFEARRIMGAARAMRVARDHPYAADPDGIALPRPVRRTRLGPDEEIAIGLPVGAGPFERLRLYVEFDVQRARGHAYVTIGGPGLALKKVPIARAGRKQGARTRRRIVVRCPACLLALRDVEHVRLRTNDRLEIRNLTISWNQPAAWTAKDRLTARLRQWREGLSRPSAA